MPGLTLVSPTPKLSFFLSFFSPNIFQANLQFAAILLAQSLMCGDYGHVIPHSAQYILRGEMMIVLQFLKFFFELGQVIFQLLNNILQVLLQL